MTERTRKTKRTAKIKFWDDEEISRVALLCEYHSVKEIASIIGRSYASTYQKIYALDLKPKSGGHKPWLASEILYLKQHHHEMTVKQLSLELGRHYQSVVYELGRLGISAKRHYKSWSGKDAKFIQSERDKGKSWERIAATMQVGDSGLRRFALRQGIK